MTELEKLEQQVRNLRFTAALRIERNRRIKETRPEKFSEFKYGKAWGSYKSLGTILGYIMKAKGEDYQEEDLIDRDEALQQEE